MPENPLEIENFLGLIAEPRFNALRIRLLGDIEMYSGNDSAARLGFPFKSAGCGQNARHQLSAGTIAAMELKDLKAKIAAIAGDFVPDSDADAPLALQEMREALMALVEN